MNAPGVQAGPSLSVVIVRFAGGGALAGTLASLASQRVGDDPEVVVAHRAGDAPDGEMRSRFLWVRWVAGDAAASPARLRTLGVQATTGAIVACTEDHCVPAPDWCARIREAHGRGHAVVGGAIDKAQPADGASWAAYLLDYGRYMPPLPAGPADYASDCNVSYPRSALDDVAENWRGEFHESTVHWALERKGVRVQLDPSIVVVQHRAVSLAAWLPERREHGRIFAGTRMVGASPLVRARFALASLVLPMVIVWRVVQRLRARGLLSRVPSSAWFPLARAAVAWSAGERRGYLRGGR